MKVPMLLLLVLFQFIALLSCVTSDFPQALRGVTSGSLLMSQMQLEKVDPATLAQDFQLAKGRWGRSRRSRRSRRASSTPTVPLEEAANVPVPEEPEELDEVDDIVEDDEDVNSLEENSHEENSHGGTVSAEDALVSADNVVEDNALEQGDNDEDDDPAPVDDDPAPVDDDDPAPVDDDPAPVDDATERDTFDLTEEELNKVKEWKTNRVAVVKMTNYVFYSRHPDRKDSPIEIGETEAIEEWSFIKTEVINMQATVEPPPPTGDGEAPPAGTTTFDANELPPLIEALDKNNYIYDETGGYNLIGIRTGIGTNDFDDKVAIVWKNGEKWQQIVYDATTDPGTHYLDNPLNSEGAAILVPGQYLEAYCRGKHQGKYDALVQRKPVDVWRRKSDGMFTENKKKFNGYFGINIHRANQNAVSQQVNKWSAGCQVIPDPTDFKELLNMITEGLIKADGADTDPNNKHCQTYTLLTKEEVPASSKWKGIPYTMPEEPTNLPDTLKWIDPTLLTEGPTNHVELPSDDPSDD